MKLSDANSSGIPATFLCALIGFVKRTVRGQSSVEKALKYSDTAAQLPVY